MEWHWLKRQFGAAAGSAFFKLLNAELPVHDLFAREVIQNSWDASQRLSKELGAESVKFKIEFDFQEVSGPEKRRIFDALKVNELKTRIEEHSYEKFGFEKSSTMLDSVADSDKVSLLYVHDYGATGLRGDPVGEYLEDSDFYRAFGEIGGNDRDTGGGSFGFGKSAFIKSSRIRCVIAYSSFQPFNGDKVTRRLWGFLYWTPFHGHTGVAQLGLLNQNGEVFSVPAEDAIADEYATKFGFRVRNSLTPEDCGTSLLILDHVLEPSELAKSIAKYWWPALEDFGNRFQISIRTGDERLRPSPRDYPELAPYLRAFEIANEPNAQLKESEFKPDYRAIKEGGVLPGSLALVHTAENPQSADEAPEGSFQLYEPDACYAHIALIRKPRMVVDYLGLPGSLPGTAIQGVFVASEAADPYLRKSEPASHNKWNVNVEESSDADWELTRKIVKGIMNRIKNSTKDFQRALRVAPETKASSLSTMDKLLAKLVPPPLKKGTSTRREPKVTPQRSTRLYSSSKLDTRLTFKDSETFIEETWTIELAKSVKEPTEVYVDFIVWAVSDGESTEVSDRILGVEWKEFPKSTFNVQVSKNLLVGTMMPNTEYTIKIKSAPYSNKWTVKTDIRVMTDLIPEGQAS